MLLELNLTAVSQSNGQLAFTASEISKNGVTFVTSSVVQVHFGSAPLH